MALAPWRQAIRAGLIHVQPGSVPWPVALRNALGVVLPVAIGLATGHLDAGLGVSAGALLVMFADAPGPYRERARNILLTALGGALATSIGVEIGGHPALLLPVVAAWTFAASLLVALGATAARVGLISILLLIISSGSSGFAGVSPFAAAASILLGGALQAAFASLAWPVRPHGPERAALRAAFTALAVAARQPTHADAAPPASHEIDAAHAMLAGDGRMRSPTLESLRILATLAERLRLELVALGESSPAETSSEVLREVHRAAARSFLLIGATVRDAHLDPLAAAKVAASWDEHLSRLQQLATATGSLAAPARHAAALGTTLRAALRNAARTGPETLTASDATQVLSTAPRPGQPWAILRANLNLRSVACRHALRSAFCVAVAVGLSAVLPAQHAYWMPMTAAIVLKPDFAGTVNYGVLRVAGTLAGLVGVSLVLHYLAPTAWLEVLLMGILCYAFRQMAPMHYGLGVAALSGLVVLLETLGGLAPGPVMVARAVGTASGSALALAAYAAWPTWERSRVRAALAAMLDDYARYLATVAAGNDNASAARNACRVARSNAQASLERLRHEPRTGAGLLALGDAVFATATRLVRLTMLLDATLAAVPRNAPGRGELVQLCRVAAERCHVLAGHARDATSATSDHAVAAAAAVVRAATADADCHGFGAIADRVDDILATLTFSLMTRSAT